MTTHLNILYLGMLSGTCLDRANAYRRLGHIVTHIDPRTLLPASSWVDHVTWHLGDHWLSPLMTHQLKHVLQGRHFDLCHVDSGEWINRAGVRVLKECATKVINYNIDDPTGSRDVRRFTCYRSAVASYDLVVVVREENVSEVKALGATNVLRVYRSADEVTHAPRSLTAEDEEKWASDVLFLGTWMPERGPFLLRLIELGVPLTIRGARWEKAPEWDKLQAHWKGGHIDGDDYAKAIQCAKVNLGLLSKGNRDLHTTRSLEIPALGALLCAERTAEHSHLFKENEEILMWSSPEECAQKCLYALNNGTNRAMIANNGHHRFQVNQLGNQHICNLLINNTIGR